MSKLERLNARVAKLLTVAVHEVLEVVRETVSEYQEKTSRTQRENDSLRRKLQELQEKLDRESTAPMRFMLAKSGGQAHDQQEEEEWSLSLRLDAEPTPEEAKPHLPEDQRVTLEEEDYGALDLDHMAVSEAEGEASPRGDGELSEELSCPAAPPPYAVKADAVADPSPSSSSVTLSPSRAEPRLSVVAPEDIKLEPEPGDYPGAEPDRYDPVVTQLSPGDGDGSYGLVFIHGGGSSVARRFGYARGADGRRGGRRFGGEDEPHACFVCGKTFSRVGNLRIHQRCHTGEKPYRCTQCGRAFSQAGDLKKHKRVHTGEKPYYCGQCGKSFSRGENLKRHQKIHAGETFHLQQAWRGAESN